MTPDSEVATEYVQSLGHRRGVMGERKSHSAIVVHTTGSGPIARWRRQAARFGEATPFETAIRIYRTIMDDAPHYVVGQGGECVQVTPEESAARHVGARDSHVYAATDWHAARKYAWWRARFPGIRSPRELAGGWLWADGSCNAHTDAIEVVPPVDDPRAPWSDACWLTLRRLVHDLSERHSIPVTREHVVTHSDAHPWARTTDAGAPWDPGIRQWPGWADVAPRLQVPVMCGPATV